MKPIPNLNLRFTFLLFFLLSVGIQLNAQTITNAPNFKICSFRVMPDSGYKFEQVRTNSSLHFKGDSLIRPASRYYWLQIHLHNPYPNRENYVLRLPNTLRYMLYYYNGRHWIAQSAGLKVADGRREAGIIPFILLPGKTNTVYLKVDVGKEWFSVDYKPNINIEKQIVYNAREQVVLFSYLLCCIALVCFLCYNLYLFFHLKDKAYNYFVIIQLGALFYLTATQSVFNIIIPFRLIYFKIWADGYLRYFDINHFFMHMGVVLIFTGLCLFTRAYLRTDEFMPKVERLLKVLPNMYIVTEVFTIISATTKLYSQFIIIDNLLIIAIILSCIAGGIIAYKRKSKTAGPFLAAILLPAIIVVLVSVNIILYGMPNPLLPAIAILSQILTFAVALVARVKEINDEYNLKAVEAVKLEAAKVAAEHKRLVIEQENEIMVLNIALEKERNEHLQLTLEANQRELAGNSLFLQQKNKLLSDLTKQLQDINYQNPDVNTDAFRDIQSSLKNNIRLDEEWDKFKLHFEQVHPNFFKDLKASHPNLTQYELRLCAYFHINLSTKEIASLLNIAPTSVRQAKTRLFKKLKS